MEEGCYLCLLEAQQLLLESASSDEVLSYQDEVAVLLALREREIGLEDSHQLERFLGRADPPNSEFRLLAEVAAAMPWNRRFAVDQDLALRRTAMASRDRWYPALERLAADSVAARYLLLTLRCSYPLDENSIPKAREGDPPLILFRLAICQGRDTLTMAQLARGDTRWVEARYFLGLNALLEGRPDDARVDIELAMATIPRWTAPAMALGNLAFSQEEFARAQELYEKALLIESAQRDALLGRTKALSYQNKYSEALDSADRLLQLGEYYIGDGHFWRAWNLYQLSHYEDAASAIGSARRFMRGPELDSLAGHIAVSRGRLEEGREDFSSALATASGHCEARYARAAVELQLQSWRSSATDFELAVSCYEGKERELVEVDAPSRREGSRQRERRETEIQEARRQQARAALQSAAAWIRVGELDRARRQATRAKAQPELDGAADALLERLVSR